MRAAGLAGLWAVGYGGWQIWWALGHRPSFGRLGTDLTIGSAWGAAGLAAAVAVAAIGLWRTRSAPVVEAARTSATGVGEPRTRGSGSGRTRGSSAWQVAGWAVVAAVAVNCPLLLLDVVGGLLPGLGIELDVAGSASRVACAVGGALLARALVAYRRGFGDCGSCARTGDPRPRTGTPTWAWWAAYGAVAACVVRIGAQVAVGFGGIPFETGVSMLLFEVGFVLAGSVLPLATVHAWGKVFPRWTLVLAGRRVPRGLVLGPAFALSGGLVVYFGVGLAQLAAESWHGRYDSEPFPEWFMWVAMAGYWVWGAGMGAAALAYQRVTRPRCGHCGRA